VSISPIERSRLFTITDVVISNQAEPQVRAPAAAALVIHCPPPATRPVRCWCDGDYRAHFKPQPHDVLAPESADDGPSTAPGFRI
jgi:hypothetical protein